MLDNGSHALYYTVYKGDLPCFKRIIQNMQALIFPAMLQSSIEPWGSVTKAPSKHLLPIPPGNNGNRKIIRLNIHHSFCNAELEEKLKQKEERKGACENQVHMCNGE